MHAPSEEESGPLELDAEDLDVLRVALTLLLETLRRNRDTGLPVDPEVEQAWLQDVRKATALLARLEKL